MRGRQLGWRCLAVGRAAALLGILASGSGDGGRWVGVVGDCGQAGAAVLGKRSSIRRRQPPPIL